MSILPSVLGRLLEKDVEEKLLSIVNGKCPDDTRQRNVGKK